MRALPAVHHRLSHVPILDNAAGGVSCISVTGGDAGSVQATLPSDAASSATINWSGSNCPARACAVSGASGDSQAAASARSGEPLVRMAMVRGKRRPTRSQLGASDPTTACGPRIPAATTNCQLGPSIKLCGQASSSAALAAAIPCCSHRSQGSRKLRGRLRLTKSPRQGNLPKKPCRPARIGCSGIGIAATRADRKGFALSARVSGKRRGARPA